MPLTGLRMNARFILNFLIECNLSRTRSLQHVYKRKQSDTSRNVSAVFTVVELQLGANLALLLRSSRGRVSVTIVHLFVFRAGNVPSCLGNPGYP